MDISAIEPLLRLLITVEFAAMAIVGLAVAVNCVSLDAEVRKLTKIHGEILSGIYDSVQAKVSEKESKRQTRLDSMREQFD